MEFGIFIPGSPLPGKSQKECSLSFPITENRIKKLSLVRFLLPFLFRQMAEKLRVLFGHIPLSALLLHCIICIIITLHYLHYYYIALSALLLHCIICIIITLHYLHYYYIALSALLLHCIICIIITLHYLSRYSRL